MRLCELFKEMLIKKGVERIWPCTKLWKLSAMVAEGRAVVCKAENCKTSMDLEEVCGNFKADAVVLPTCSNPILTKNELLKEAEKLNYPYVLVDCRYANTHSEKELRRLKLQLKCTVGVIRKFMWRDKLIVSGKKFPEVEAPFYSEAKEFFYEKGIDRVILLDPNAEEVFSSEKESCYVVGGIVDLAGNKRGLTSKLGKELESEGIDVISRKFVLRGDVVGVPDRINHIVEILLMCVVDGIDLEKAILSVQTPLVARWRLRKELAKLSFRLDRLIGLNFPVRALWKKDLEKVRWLKVSEEDIYKECSKLGFYVVDNLEAIK